MMNQKNAKTLHEIFVQDTAFRGTENCIDASIHEYVSFEEMYEMLRNGTRWGKAEAYSIITALVMAGAKFEGEMTFLV